MGGGSGSQANPRNLAGWFPAFEVALAVIGSLVALLTPVEGGAPGQQLLTAAFLVALAVWLGTFIVPLDRGYLRLTMIALQAAAMALPSSLAAFVGLIAGVSWVRHGPKGYRYAGVGASVLWTAGGAAVRISIGTGSGLRVVGGYLAVVGFMTLANWTTNLISIRLLYGESMRTAFAVTVNRAFIEAFAYFALAAILIANVLNGSISGYVMAAVVALLSVTLTETLEGRRRRAALEAQVADSQRHVGYSRAMEGVAHGLRHQLAISKGYLEDLLETRLAEDSKGKAESAKKATDVALQLLDRLQSGARPKVYIDSEPVNLRQIAIEALELVRGRADDQGTRLVLAGRERPLRVPGDPALLRDVVTELCLNALAAVGNGGRVVVTVGKRRGGWGALSVADTGPGIPDSRREHLFEPHYTTKPSGTGMGLFTAFGVLQEHRGKLLYEGGPKGGAIFTLLLPTSAAASVEAAEAIAVAGDGLNPALVAQRLSR